MKTAISGRLKQWLFRASAIFISMVAALVLCELLIRLVAPQDLTGTWFEKSARGNDINRANWTARHQFKDRVVYYRINDLHLRGGPIRSGTNRFLCVGDSFTFGWLLEETNTSVHTLDEFAARDFPGWTLDFLNGGQGGAGTADSVAFIEDFGPQIRPRAILVFLNNDDTLRSVQHELFKLDPANPNAVVATKPSLIALGLRNRMRASPAYQWTLEHVQLVQLVRMACQRKIGRANLQRAAANHAGVDVAADVQLEKAIFLRLRDWCVVHDCQLFVVTAGFNAFPDFPLGRTGNVNKVFLDAAPKFFSENGINFHDIGPDLFASAHGDFRQITIPGDFHPDERGAKLVADFTWAWLKPQLREMPEPQKNQ